MFFHVIICVAVELRSIDEEMSNLIGLAWSPNTLMTRNSQWRKFLNFCASLGVCPIPADALTVGRYLVRLSSNCKYVTVNNHLSAITILHKFHGFNVQFREFFVIRLILSGIKSKYGNETTPKRCLTLVELRAMYAILPKSELNETLWAIVMLSFRSLLRKCNLVPSSDPGHVLCRRDISFVSSGAIITVGSTKTLRYKERLLKIPLSWAKDSSVCVVSMLIKHFTMCPSSPNSPLFLKRVRGTLVPIQYPEVLSFIKNCVASIGLDPRQVGFHSLRRSGATYLHGLGVPLIDIKLLGDWKSLAVLQYLVTTWDRKCEIENLVVSSF